MHICYVIHIYVMNSYIMHIQIRTVPNTTFTVSYTLNASLELKLKWLNRGTEQSLVKVLLIESSLVCFPRIIELVSYNCETIRLSSIQCKFLYKTKQTFS